MFLVRRLGGAVVRCWAVAFSGGGRDGGGVESEEPQCRARHELGEGCSRARSGGRLLCTVR